MALTAQARNVATGRVHAYLTVRGAVAGALSLALVELASLVWMRLAAPVDDATARASSEVAALGVERGVIVLRLVLAIALCGAVIGAAHALMRSVGAALSPTRRRPTLRGDVGWTFATVVVWTMARACTVPGLIVPSLPAGRLVGWVVRHAHPAVFHVCMVGLVLAALWPVRGGWRSTPRPATCELGAGRRLMGYAVAAAVVLVSVVGTVVWRHGRTRPAGRAGPLLNVLVLAADSVRPDHISRLGYGRRTTPHIDALIDDGALFERAMAPLARTTPSWLSVLTGRYPHHHGIRHMFPRREVRARSMQALPKWARAQGYRTSVISDYAGDFFSLFDLGFEAQEVPPPLNLRTVFERELLLHSPLALSLLEPLPSSIRPRAFRYLLNDASASRLADEAIASLDGDGPFFSVVFFSATHVPFASPYPYYRRFSGDDYAGPNAFAYDIGSIADISRAEEPLSPTEAALCTMAPSRASTTPSGGSSRRWTTRGSRAPRSSSSWLITARTCSRPARRPCTASGFEAATRPIASRSSCGAHPSRAGLGWHNP